MAGLCERSGKSAEAEEAVHVEPAEGKVSEKGQERGDRVIAPIFFNCLVFYKIVTKPAPFCLLLQRGIAQECLELRVLQFRTYRS